MYSALVVGNDEKGEMCDINLDNKRTIGFITDLYYIVKTFSFR